MCLKLYAFLKETALNQKDACQPNVLCAYNGLYAHRDHWLVREMAAYFTCMMINSTFIIPEVVIDFKGYRYRTILHQLYPHQCLVTCSKETTNVVVPSPKMSWAPRLVARGVSAPIWETFFLHQSKVLSVLANEVRKS